MTIDKLLKKVNDIKDDKVGGKQSKDSVLKGVVRHYLFLHFRSAMQKSFYDLQSKYVRRTLCKHIHR